MNDLHSLASRLRALRDEWGSIVARVAFEEHSATLPAADHARLAALVFGGEASMLMSLIERQEKGRPKSPERWQRDLTLAAEIAVDLGRDALVAQGIDVAQFQHSLRHGLVELLQERRRVLSAAERIRAAFLLGALGDPRFPVTIEEWGSAVEQALDGGMNGSHSLIRPYFCHVEPGTYLIGAADDDLDADDIEKPCHRIVIEKAFFIARYPITNAQWAVWVASGGQPPLTADNPYLNRPNQPVVGVDWRVSMAFCAWLSEQLGVRVSLPSENHWEAAARGGDARRYPWGNEWQLDRASTLEDLEVRQWPWTVPVGCYPAGAAPCGALDMVGNVWEWMENQWHVYPGARDPVAHSGWHMLRGGSFSQNNTSARCTARFWNRPIYALNLEGLRVMLDAR